MLGFHFTGVKVLVERPGYNIVIQTIKRGFRLSDFASPYFVASWFSPCKVLELVASFSTSPSSSKTEFVCIFYCISVLEVL